MAGQDIATALQLLGFVKRIPDPRCGPRGYKMALCVDWNLVESHASRVRASKNRVPCDPDALRWRPLVYSTGELDEGSSPGHSPEVVSPIRKTPVAAAVSSPERRKADIVKSPGKSSKAVKHDETREKRPKSQKLPSKIVVPTPEEDSSESEEVDEEESEDENEDDDSVTNDTSSEDNEKRGSGRNYAADEVEEDNEEITDKRSKGKSNNLSKNFRNSDPNQQTSKRGRKRRLTVDSVEEEDGIEEKSKDKILGKVLKARAKKVANLEEEENAHSSNKQQESVKKPRRVSKTQETPATNVSTEKVAKRRMSKGAKSEVNVNGESGETEIDLDHQGQDLNNSSDIQNSEVPKERAKDRKCSTDAKEKEKAEKEKTKVDPEKQRKDREDRYNRRMNKRGADDEEQETPKTPAPAPLKKKLKKEEDSTKKSKPLSSTAVPKKKARRFKGYKYWGAPPSIAKRKKKPVAIVAPTSSAGHSNVTQVSHQEKKEKSKPEQPLLQPSSSRNEAHVSTSRESPAKQTKRTDESRSSKSPYHISEEDLAKEGEEFGKNALKNFEDEEMDELDNERETNSRPHFDFFDKQRDGEDSSFPLVHELTMENVKNLDDGDYPRHSDFDDFRADPERNKDMDSESLRVIPSGPSSCNTEFEDSDLSSQPSVPPSSNGGNSQSYENENRSSSSCSGNVLQSASTLNTSVAASAPTPTQHQLQQPQQVATQQNSTSRNNTTSVLVMPPHVQQQQQQYQQMPNQSQTVQQPVQTIQKGN